jgi:hypothetical protein
MTMTSSQRVEAAFAHREPDRTPVFEYVLLSPLAEQLLGRPYAVDAGWQQALNGLGWERAVEQRAIDQLDLAVLLGHDLMYVVPNPPPPAATHTATTSVACPDLPADPVEALQRRNEIAAQAPPPDDDTFRVYAALIQQMKHRGLDLPLLAPAYGHGVWTDTELMQTMILAPDVATEHFQLATARSRARIDRYMKLGVGLIGVGGDFSGQRPMISPSMYQQFIVPEVCSLSRYIHAAGARSINASDGDLWPVIDDFLLQCEVDAYLEIDMHAGMDLRRLKREYGDRITLFGNLDCGNTLSFSTPEQVREHVIDCLEAGLGNGGHILCASNAITASVPLVNYLSVINAYRDFFSLPRFTSGSHL